MIVYFNRLTRCTVLTPFHLTSPHPEWNTPCDLYHLVDTKSWATKTGRSDAAKCSLLPLFCQKSKNQKNNSTQITN